MVRQSQRRVSPAVPELEGVLAPEAGGALGPRSRFIMLCWRLTLAEPCPAGKSSGC